jgi:hypothetical protein
MLHHEIIEADGWELSSSRIIPVIVNILHHDIIKTDGLKLYSS